MTFATNLVQRMTDFDDTTSLIALLETVREDVGGPKRSAIADLIAALAPRPVAKPGADLVSPTGPNVFISYARHDFPFVDRLRHDLAAHHIPYWIDREGLTPGTAHWERNIRAAIQDSRAVVWVVSPASYESEYVNSELACARMVRAPTYPVWAEGENWVACVPLGKHKFSTSMPVHARRRTVCTIC